MLLWLGGMANFDPFRLALPTAIRQELSSFTQLMMMDREC
jgi:hypothetical protein